MGSILRDLKQAEDDGFTFFNVFRKRPIVSTAANIWLDLSMSPGNPVPNYYIGAQNKFTPMFNSLNDGIPHGANVGPKKKFVTLLGMQCDNAAALPLNFMMLDYIGFYAFCDESITDPQPMDNSTPLPRHADGRSVQIMPVVVGAQTGFPNQFVVKYTNDKGVSGRVTPPHVMTSQATNGTILSSAQALANSRAPFMALQDGDTGVRQVEEVTFLGTGDVGLVTFVLAKTIMRHIIRGIDAPVEQTPFFDASELPTIFDDAYVNFIVNPFGSLSGVSIYGYMKTTWMTNNAN
jgi:hypothetical protein